MGGSIIPSGKNHDLANFIALFFITILVFERLGQVQATVFAASYLIGLFLFSPDLDTKSTSYRRWGPLRYIWLPYILLFRHRGLSHNPIIGPLIRLMYLTGLALALTTALKIKSPTIPTIIPLKYSILFIIGYWVPSVVHWMVDKRL